MKFKHLAVTVIAALVSFVPVHNANAKDIVVTIKPLHSLVTGVVGNTAKTHLMVSGNQSPHGFKFKPSQVKLLNNSAVVFYIGDTFETFMEKAFDNIPSNVVKVPVAEKARLKLLPYREGGAWEEWAWQNFWCRAQAAPQPSAPSRSPQTLRYTLRLHTRSACSA